MVGVTTQRAIISARKAIRKKLSHLRSLHRARERLLEETFKPITDKLEVIADKQKPHVDEELKKNKPVLFGRATDTVYGPKRHEDGTLKLGDTDISIYDNYISVGSKQFPFTDGLSELLFLKHPNDYTKKDLQFYGEIMRLTNAHKRGHTEVGSIKSTKNPKYKKIIVEALQRSGGLYKTDVHSGFSQSIANLTRLKLLYASKAGGNTNHQSEINELERELQRRRDLW